MENKRPANFTESEINFLVNLVNKKNDKIECKKTDKTTAAEKNRCWIEIQDDFNALFTSFRSYKTLRMKYENLKKSAKKIMLWIKKKCTKRVVVLNHRQKQRQQMTTPYKLLEQVEGLPSIYDDDKIENVLPTVDLNEGDNDEGDNDCRIEKPTESSSREENSQWDKYTLKMLRAPKHSALSGVKRKATRDVWADVAPMKIKKLELEMKVIEEEPKLRKIKLELEIEELKHRVGKCSSISTPAVINKYPKEF